MRKGGRQGNKQRNKQGNKRGNKQGNKQGEWPAYIRGAMGLGRRCEGSGQSTSQNTSGRTTPSVGRSLAGPSPAY